MDFTAHEMTLLIEALEYRASRHESEARFNPRSARPHDDKAAAMRKLRNKILKLQAEARVTS
jgi:hypothetical protein